MTDETPEPIAVAIVAHTHWDREWYLAFETFRVRLVGLIDGLLDLLERDQFYERFLLDGQTAVIDDYLAVRPEAESRIKALARAGRLQVGPWMILMDEFMVSGETIVRNLQWGMKRARELGGLMEVGYLPDMFGHVAQMPQILSLAGLNDAVVWRGVPNEIVKSAFWWEAPNGSRVRAEYLIGSYSNGRDLPDTGSGLVARAHSYEQELGSARLDNGSMLLMNGTDHQIPQPGLSQAVAQANESQARYEFKITTLADYLAGVPRNDLALWRGEMRSGGRANVLMGVASNRVDVHRAAARAERAVERRAEPLNALLREPDQYPTTLLATAWENLILNSAHDSSCACSSDEVVDAVMVRYQQARQIGDALVNQAVQEFADRSGAPMGSTVVVNPTAHRRSGTVNLSVPGMGPVHFVSATGISCPTQIVNQTSGGRVGFSTLVVGQKIRWVLEMMRGPEFAGVRIKAVTVRELATDEWEYTFVAADSPDTAIDLGEWREELLARGMAGATLRVRQTEAPVRRVIVAVPEIAGYGWLSLTAVEGTGTGGETSGEGNTLTNAHIVVEADPATGQLTVTTTDGVSVSRAHALVDGGDGGDTYNYSPPAEDQIIDRPHSVELEVLESGPVRSRLLVTTISTVPAAAIGDEQLCSRRSDETVEQKIVTTVELRADENFVRLHVEIDNHARDHRLRAHLTLPEPVASSDAECAFGVVSRDLEAEGGPGEFGLPTFVSRRFVDASNGSVGCAIIHDGLLEYEVLTDESGAGTQLALTLLRATGYLSRAQAQLRPNPAGPLMPLTGAQMAGTTALDYAILPHRGDWQQAQLYSAADAFLVPLERARVKTESTPTIGDQSGLIVTGAEVAAVNRYRGELTVRVFNPTNEPSELCIITSQDYGDQKAVVVDFNEQVVDTFSQTRTLGPNEIITVRFSAS